MRRLALLPVLASGLFISGCHPAYSPDTYAANAAQQEAAVQRGVIIGVREVIISADGTVGAATGAAVGGVAGSQVGSVPVVTALGAIGGTLVGGISGEAAAQAVAKTKGWEYIVEEEPGDKLVSVTQTSKISLPLGLHVLVIAGTQQARIVPDYTIQIATTPPPPPPNPAATTFEYHITPTLPPMPANPVAVANTPAAPVPAP